MGTDSKVVNKNSFRGTFRAHLDEVLPHGQVKPAAALLGINYNTISRWGTPDYNGLPTIEQVHTLAEFTKCSPAWLAYDIGPKESGVGDKDLWEALKTPALIEWLNVFRQATEEEQTALIVAARRYAPHLKAMLTLLQTPAPIPQNTIVEHKDKIKAYKPPPSAAAIQANRAGEDQPDFPSRGIPEKKARRRNTRDQIAVIHLADKQSPNVIKLPQWIGLAAGPGRELERCTEYRYFRELPYSQGDHSMVMGKSSDSMMDTLLPGDMIVVRSLNNSQGLTLEPMDADIKTPMQIVRSQVGHDDICILSVNDDLPTLKRVMYQHDGNPSDWQMLITADNPAAEGFPRSIGKKDKVTFWAKLIALCDPEDRKKGKAYVPKG